MKWGPDPVFVTYLCFSAALIIPTGGGEGVPFSLSFIGGVPESDLDLDLDFDPDLDLVLDLERDFLSCLTSGFSPAAEDVGVDLDASFS